MRTKKREAAVMNHSVVNKTYRNKRLKEGIYSYLLGGASPVLPCFRVSEDS